MCKCNATCIKKGGERLNRIWVDNEQLIIECFDCYIYIHGRCSLFNTNALTGFMISLFLAAPALTVRRAWNLMGTSVRNGIRFFLLFRKKYSFIQKLKFSYWYTFRKLFQTSGVIGLNNSATFETLKLKTYFNSWK